MTSTILENSIFDQEIFEVEHVDPILGFPFHAQPRVVYIIISVPFALLLLDV
tara:strand:- start:477 stop:632 length:156 start_codon:yes stop_codon:yes gene_type:complete